MTDEEIIEVAASFREGILNGRSSHRMCAMVSWPLSSLMSFYGLSCTCAESEVETSSEGTWNHIWIKLPDGRALDPTADQFGDYPAVYLGPPVPALHQEIKA